MTTAYAVPQDVYDLGLTAQAFVVRPRGLDPRAGDAFDFATGTFSLIGHGYAADDAVRFLVIGTGAVPAGAVALTPYYPLPLDFYRFRLSATQGGSPLTFTDAGSGAWSLQIDPERRLRRLLLSVSADIDQDLTQHATPLLPDPVTHKFPDKIVGIVARTVARRATAGMEFENPAFRAASERLFAEEKRDDAQREAWRMGQPIYPEPTDQNTVPDDAALATNAVRRGEVCDMRWLTGLM